MVRKPAERTPAHLYFDGELPFYVNRVSESYELHLHEHEFTEICYVAEGGGFHYIGEETLPVRRGDVFAIPLGTTHVFRPRSTDRRHPLVVYNFIFMAERVARDLEGFPGLRELPLSLQRLNLRPGSPGWTSFRDASGAVHAIFKDAYEQFRLREIGFVARIYGLFLMLLTELERHLAGLEKGEPVVPPRDRLVANALDLMHREYASPLSVRQAAEAAGVSERHFHRMFAAATGTTFTRYLQDVRIERSCELLRATRMTVQEVAEAVGYQDKKFFSGLFRQRTGQTPGTYRKG